MGLSLVLLTYSLSGMGAQLKQVYSSSATALEEICLKYLTFLDDVWPSWLTHLLNNAWTLRAVPLANSPQLTWEDLCLGTGEESLPVH